MADNKIIVNQIADDANVIGYDPDLRYVKERTATGEYIGSDNSEQNEENSVFNYTNTLQGFIENTPSSVLDNIDYVLGNIERLKDNLAKEFENEQKTNNSPYSNTDSDDTGNYNEDGTDDNTNGYNPYSNIRSIINRNAPDNAYKYVNNSGDNTPEENSSIVPYSELFADHYNNPDGTPIPELINCLNDISDSLNELADSIKVIYFDMPDITTEEAKDIDNDYINEFKIRERNDNSKTINYMTLSFDAILNKTLSYNIFRNNKKAIKCAKVIDSNEKTQATTNDIDIINKLFEDVNDKLKLRARGYKRNKDKKLINKAMFNYYEKRKNLNDLYQLYEKDPESEFLGNRVIEYTNKLYESIRDINRVLMYNQNYLDEITKLENEKYNIQKLNKSVKNSKTSAKTTKKPKKSKK